MCENTYAAAQILIYIKCTYYTVCNLYCRNASNPSKQTSFGPSFAQLFTNIDTIVHQGRYSNPSALFLKSIAISGLPVDELPCLEVWDCNGCLYSSHVQWRPHANCTWNGEYGDGLYIVSTSVLGDFSIMCRFGGQHAMTRDKTTVLFKYQNNTGKAPLRNIVCCI